MVRSLFFVYDNYIVIMGQAGGLRKNAGWKRRGSALNVDKELIQNSVLPGF